MVEEIIFMKIGCSDSLKRKDVLVIVIATPLHRYDIYLSETISFNIHGKIFSGTKALILKLDI